MEVVAACRSGYWGEELHGGACGDGVSGRATAAMDDGRVIEMRAGDVFYISPGHDSWVVGDEPYVSFHFLVRRSMQRGRSDP